MESIATKALPQSELFNTIEH